MIGLGLGDDIGLVPQRDLAAFLAASEATSSSFDQVFKRGR
jgi:hypothetical protein